MKEQFPKSWRMRGLFGDLIIVRRKDVRRDTYVANSPVGLPALVESWLADPVEQRVVLEMYEAIGGHRGPNEQRWQDVDLQRYVKPKLTEAFRSGELITLPAPATMFGSVSGKVQKGNEADAGSSQNQPKAQTRKSWIEIELVGDDGKPLGGERYRIELPDGTFVSGILDSQGRIRFDGIDPGECEVAFPDLSAGEWRPAG